MWLDTPPQPPIEAQQALAELADYYRRLIGYHQRAATLAASQLAHLEAILNPSLNGTNTWQQNQHNSKKLIADIETIPNSLPEVKILSLDEEIAIISQIMAENRGKILHLNLLVREVYEDATSEREKELTETIKKTLLLGEQQGLWFSVPDAPDCWTIDLQAIPDLVDNQTQKKSNTSQSLKKLTKNPNLPSSEPIKGYENLNIALVQCLKEHYPQSMTVNQVLNWLYPQGLTKEEKKIAAQVITDILEQGCNQKDWYKSSLKRYLWKNQQK
jgi:hypothetical protein